MLFEKLSMEKGIDVYSRVVDRMFVPSVEYVRTYVIRNTNMDYHIWRGMAAVGQAIERPDYVHEAIERINKMVNDNFLFDGFWKEVSLSYHSQSYNGIEIVNRLLSGYTDPEGYVSQRTGIRLDSLNMERQFPILDESQALMGKLTYLDGKYLPIQDTWAYGVPSGPKADTGSLLMPAAGIARMSKGTGSAQSQLYMTFSPKYGHNHYDPPQSLRSA